MLITRSFLRFKAIFLVISKQSINSFNYKTYNIIKVAIF
jgi:hypothetical protein